MECADIEAFTFAEHTVVNLFWILRVSAVGLGIKVNSLAVSSKRIQRFEGKLNICRGKQKLAWTRSSKISRG